jgi:dUTP pyrophosphatase
MTTGKTPYIMMKITGLLNNLRGSLFPASRPASIGVVRLDTRADLPLRATELAAGWDVTAACLDEPVVLEPGDRHLFKLGFALELPASMEAQVRPRSGWALKYGITVLNSPGTIDADYKGECGVILVNHGKERFVVHPGDRIAQLVFASVPPVVIKQFDNQTVSNRGAGGFGSTGR